MNRRTFTQAMAAAALSAGAPRLSAAPAGKTVSANAPQFPLSVMLWTVFTDLPFEERLAKVAEAGYNKIQLVGEYNAHNWTQADYDRANAARKRLGIEFDATAGLKDGIADPGTRDAFLAELKEALTPMETLGCPAMIVLSGNVVPGLSHEAQHQSCIEGLKRAAALVEGRQINGQPVRLLLECIHLEENPKYFLTSANEAIEIVRAVNHPQVQFLYDIYHEQMSFGNLIEKLDKHIDVIGLIHVADVPGRHEPGTGEINYGNIYKRLAELNYRHNMAMEFLPVGDAVGTLRAAKAQVLSAG
ncbi:MAG TPA: TIM barrel protein [Terracidiphilus sp.]|nr:TIM barrel protein [Terracidiphilus sp.]